MRRLVMVPAVFLMVVGGDYVARAEPGVAPASTAAEGSAERADENQPEQLSPAPPIDCPNCSFVSTFRLATINIQLFPPIPPFSHIQNGDRAVALGKDFAASDWSVILVQEGFSDTNLSALSGAARCGSRFEKCLFHLPAGSPTFVPLNGGLGVLSAFDFKAKPPFGIKWADCYGTTDNASDCLANKGFAHYEIQVPNQDDPRYPVTLDVVNLHHDAGNCDKNEAGCALNADARRKQLQQLAQEMDRYPNRTFLLAGDFNIVGPPCTGVGCNDVHQYEWIKEELDRHDQRDFGDAWAAAGSGPGYTADSLTNSFRTCADPANPGSLGCRQERIDYIWTSDIATCYKINVRDIRVETFPAGGRVPSHQDCKNGSCEHLSDHYGLVATVEIWRDDSEPLKPPCDGQAPWSVDFLSPDGPVPPSSDLTARVQVGAFHRQEADYVELYVDGVGVGTMNPVGDGVHELAWRSGLQGREHRLLAVAYQGGRERARKEITVPTVRWRIDFIEPLRWVEPERDLEARVQVVAPQAGQEADHVTFTVDGVGRGAMTALGSGFYKLGWRSGRNGTDHTLEAQAYDAQGALLASTRITVTASSTPVVYVDGPGVLVVGETATHTAVADNAQGVRLFFDGALVCQRAGETCAFTWTATAGSRGSHRLEAVGVYNGQPTLPQARSIEVIEVSWQETVVNEYAVVAEVTGLVTETRHSWRDVFVPTRYRTAEYACAVIHYEARGGDIGEAPFRIYDPGPIRAYLDDTTEVWRLNVDFNTVWEDGSGLHSENRPETWTVKVLCARTEVASVIEKPGLGDNVSLTLDFGFQTRVCGIAGFNTRYGFGDIEENGAQDIMRMYLDRSFGRYFLRADFATHDQHERWDVNLLCLQPEAASLDAPVPDKPFFTMELTGLRDGPLSAPTGIPTSDYVCGVVGFAAMDGDIDESDFRGSPGVPLLLAYMEDQGGTWHFRGDFRTHHNHERWEHVNVLCARKSSAPPAAWNTSHRQVNTLLCGGGFDCQVLMSESRNASGTVTVSGGGYSGSPSLIGHVCALDEVAIFVDSRDPDTGRPRFDFEHLWRCARSGDRVQLSPGTTYDFRGPLVRGGEALPFEILPEGTPFLAGAVPQSFPAPWGPGIALTWTPTSLAAARYYEIEYSTDRRSWSLYTRERDVSWGGWINHHGSIQFGPYLYALPPGQTYHYRVRVRDAVKPISGWSNVVAGTVERWNRAPALDVVSSITVNPGEIVQIDVRATDPEGRWVEIQPSGLPAFAGFNRADSGSGPVNGTGIAHGRLIWGPEPSDAGTHFVWFTARDEFGEETTALLQIIVCDPNLGMCGFF